MLTFYRPYLAVLLSLSGYQASASVAHLRADNVNVTYKNNSGTFSANNVDAGHAETSFSASYLTAELKYYDAMMHVTHEGKELDFGSHLNFLGTCQETQMAGSQFNIDETAINVGMPFLRRDCQHHIITLQNLELSCQLNMDDPDTSAPEAGSQALHACLNNGTQIALTSFSSQPKVSPSWLLQPFLPKSVTSIQMNIANHELESTFTINTPLLGATQGRMRGHIEYLNNEHKIRVKLYEITAGSLPVTKFTSLLPIMFDPDVVKYYEENKQGIIEVQLKK